MTRIKDSLINYFTLFGSMSTLICCALPSLLVSLGLGAVLAGIASNIPALIWISEHKIQVFVFSGTMLLLNGFLIWKNKDAPCPIDPKLRQACISGRKTSRNIYFFSILISGVGFFFAYLAPILE
jgi:hypothetical protein